jgi:hypothetical protein
VVVEKPTRGMKVNGANFGAAPTDHDPLVKGVSKSVILSLHLATSRPIPFNSSS